MFHLIITDYFTYTFLYLVTSGSLPCRCLSVPMTRMLVRHLRHCSPWSPQSRVLTLVWTIRQASGMSWVWLTPTCSSSGPMLSPCLLSRTWTSSSISTLPSTSEHAISTQTTHAPWMTWIDAFYRTIAVGPRCTGTMD